MTSPTFTIGSLVKARGREWVVLPGSEEDLLLLRPLGGTDAEVTGIYRPLEKIEPARFDLPDPERVGDHRSSKLLRDAVRLSSRAGAGPFRSFARIAVEPRPYQLVPLLMALRQDPVRLLIADDVGVGKTVESCLIAREMLDRGEIRRTAVLCPPNLAEQWTEALRSQFHIESVLVLSSTASRLERDCRVDETLFDLHPHVVVSLDYIKSDRRRNEFLRAAPEFVIVDEAHACSFGAEGRGGRHQRHELVSALARDPARHLVLVTATPHSGKEESFRSLLAFLDPAFPNFPEELTGPQNEVHRKRLARHFVQRRRGDLRRYLEAETPFPAREKSAKGEDGDEATYALSPEYRRLFDRALAYARETVTSKDGEKRRQRVRWWSALALLRALSSSPAAAAETLRTRSSTAGAQTAEEADLVGRRSVLDLDAEDVEEASDVTAGADPSSEDDRSSDDRTPELSPSQRRLLDLAREADALLGAGDRKLLEAVSLIKALLAKGRRPIVFCKFIPTAEYVARELRERLSKGVEVAAVTGRLPPADRAERVAELAKNEKRVLVATDCLSEGINLQEYFDAVLHYDLSWNPTRHEQREGRVDRYGQPRPTVKIVTLYGKDNPVDGIVLDVLIRKHRKIRSSLGISVPVPVDTNSVVEAVFEGLLLREKSPPFHNGATSGVRQAILPGLEEYLKPQREDLHRLWDAAAEREKRSRTVFAQESIHVDEVQRELVASRQAVGSASDVARFTESALRAHGAHVSPDAVAGQGALRFDLKEVPRALRDALRGAVRDAQSLGDAFTARFELPVEEPVLHLSRTHPVVEALAAHVLDTALDPASVGPTEKSVARRAAAIRTRAVEKRTTLLLVRFRFDLVTRTKDGKSSQLAEECRLLAFAGPPETPEWLEEPTAEALLDAEPAGNILPEQASGFVRKVVDGFESLRPRIEEEARARAKALLDAHRRVREEARIKGAAHAVEPQLPADVLGIYVFLPVAATGAIEGRAG